MILRDRRSTLYDLASLFRGRRNTLDRWSGKIGKGTTTTAPPNTTITTTTTNNNNNNITLHDNYNYKYTTLHYTTLITLQYTATTNTNTTTLHKTTLDSLHYTTTTTATTITTALHCTALHYNYSYSTLHDTSLDYTTLYHTAVHNTTVHYIALHQLHHITPYYILHHSTPQLQLQLHYTIQLQLHYTTLQLQLRYTTLHPALGWGDHCNHRNHSKKHNSNHLSVHQWIRSAIRDSQQPNSPVGFLFLNWYIIKSCGRYTIFHKVILYQICVFFCHVSTIAISHTIVQLIHHVS